MPDAVINSILSSLGQALGPAEAAALFAGADDFVAAREAGEAFLGALREADLGEQAALLEKKIEELKGAKSLVEASHALAGISAFVGHNVSLATWRRIAAALSSGKGAPRFESREAVAERLTRALRSPTETGLEERIVQLREKGVPNPEEVTRVEAEMGFHLNLDPRVIQARAEELKKLFTIVSLPVPDEFRNLPPSQQRALKLIGKAMQRLDIPHRLQNTPHGEVFEALVTQTPVLAPLRPYYLRWAGPFDLTRSELSADGQHKYYGFLPGMEKVTRPPGGGMYPSDMTAEKFRTSVTEGSNLDEDMRVIFRYDDKGQLVAIPYSKAYAEWLEPAATLLEEAAALLKTDLPEMARYLRITANAYRTNDFTAVDEAWVRLTGDPIDMDLGPVEEYADKVRHHLAQLSGMFQIRNPNADAELAILKANFALLEERLPVPNAYKLPPEKRIPPPISAVLTIYATANGNSGEGIARAYNRPNDERVREKLGKRIVLVENIGKARDESQEMQTLTELALAPNFHHLATTRGANWFFRLHELAHGHGVEFVIQNPNIPSRKAIGKIHGSLEELKADVTGIHDAKELVETGIISEDILHEIYVSFVRRCIGAMRRGLAEDHIRGALVALNFLQERGAIRINLQTGVVEDFDFERYGQAISELSGMLIQIKGDGNKKAAESLYARYGTTPPKGVEHILKAMETTPIDIIINYQFERELE